MNRCNHFGRARGRRRLYGASVHMRTKSQLRAAITTDHSTVRQTMSAAVANDVPVAVGEIAAAEGGAGARGSAGARQTIERPAAAPDEFLPAAAARAEDAGRIARHLDCFA